MLMIGCTGTRDWIDAVCLSVTEGCEWCRECECGEDIIYEECRRIMR